MSKTTYLPVAGFPHYRVGDDGSLWSNSALYRAKLRSTKEWNRLKGCYYRGYTRVVLCNGKIRRQVDLHSVIMESFVGPRPKDMQVCHNDGNGTNNKLSNLRYDTAQGNTNDKFKHGTIWSNLTEAKVRKILSIHRQWIGVKLAKRFKISQQQYSRIINGHSWKRVHAKIKQEKENARQAEARATASGQTAPPRNQYHGAA